MPWSIRKHPLEKTEFIAPMNVNTCAKVHLHTSNFSNIILNHLTIKALTSDFPWHNLNKNCIELWFLLMYITTWKTSRSWMEPHYISIHKMIVPRSWDSFFAVEYFSLFVVSFSILGTQILGKFHICLTIPIQTYMINLEL